MKLSQVIEQLVEERGLDRNILNKIVAESMLSAFQKKYPNLILDALYNKETDQIDIFVEKTVVNTVSNEESQISLRKAKGIKENVKIDENIWVPFEKPIGRIEILKAKQFIAQKIRSIEAEAIYSEYNSRVNTIVYGVMHKCERKGIIVKLQDDTMAFLPKSLMIPGDKCIVGYPIRALIKEVHKEARENQIILDRASSDFLKQLFILEVPEIYDKLIEVKNIVRAPGYKSKVLVFSNEKNVDAVGTCIGVGGSRIKPILRELGSEKIDVIADTQDKEELIKDSLKPAQVNKVEIIDERSAKAWVEEDQRAVAIGKMGQNIMLASKLTGFDIQLAHQEPSSKEKDQEDLSDL